MKLLSKFISLFLLIFAGVFLNSCATIYYVDESTASQNPNYQSETVYVTNPNHEAYRILKDSEIYALTDDVNWPNTLTLNSYEVQGGCGMGMLGTVATLGVVPDSGRSVYNLSYTLITPQASQTYAHRISYYRSTSLWNTAAMPFAKTEAEIQAKALHLSPREYIPSMSTMEAPLAPAP